MKNTTKIYWFSFFWMFLVFIPVIVPFFQSVGLSMHQIFQLQALFGIAVVIFEVPTGYLCDLWGRKRSLILGTLCSGIAFTYLVFANSFWGLAIFEITIALATSFVSGADVSLLYDSIDKNDRGSGQKTLANMQFASVSGESVAAILGGLLATYSFFHVTVANAITGWIPLFLALSIKEAEYEKMSHTSHWSNFKTVFHHIFSNEDKLLLMTFINLTTCGLSTFFAVWMLQKYWEINAIPIGQFGLLWAGLNFSVGLAGKQVHTIEKKIGPTPLLVFLGLAPVIGYFGMSYTTGYVGVALGLLFYLSRGITHVLLKDALNWRTPSAFRATTNSLLSFFFRLGFAIFGPAVGYLIDTRGLNFALRSVGCAFTLLFIALLVPYIFKIKREAPKYIPDLN